jgi:hypothetical protein
MINSSSCIEYEGGRNKKGYGWGRFPGFKNPQLAHRAVWIQTYGPIVDDLTVDHICFNRACVNTEHLQLLTRSENAAKREGGFVRKESCPTGHLYNDENTKWKTKEGIYFYQECRACHRNRQSEYRRAVSLGV